MPQRIDYGRADRTADTRAPAGMEAVRAEPRSALIAALRFAGAGLDYHRMSELRRRALCGHAEATR